MTSLQRRVIFASACSRHARWLWAAAALGLLTNCVLIARACGYEFDVVVGYGGYFLLYVVLPGVVATRWIHQGPLSLTKAVALGIPTGFAIEIFSFLALSALGAKEYYPSLPVVWAGLMLASRYRCGDWPVRVRLSAHHAGLAAVLGIAFLATGIMAASQMFSESPLADGLPARAIFHDWVYLVSRAAVIKHNWPLDDPSLAGTPLQYHYFMMVHAAAASWTTGVELSLVLLRLIFLPLGAVLVLQAYLLGRRASGSPWGGVLAALMAVMASEVSFAPSYGHPMFLGLFVRWLFVSPTFFFGMIYWGALLVAVCLCGGKRRLPLRHYLWLLLLAAAGTGAKGTVLPVFICAMGLWIAWRLGRDRRIPWRLVGFMACFIAAFLAVYIPTMSAWRTGDAAFNPFHVFELTEFWRQQLPRWQSTLEHWFPTAVAAPLAMAGCAAVVFAGTCGVRLLAIPFLFTPEARRRANWVTWPAACLVASTAMGLTMELNSYGELYVILMMRLPMAALAAAFVVVTFRRLRAIVRADRESGSRSHRLRPALMFRQPVVAGAALVVAAALAMQTHLWWQRNQIGLGEWLKTPAAPRADDYMKQLHEALRWVRDNTEPHAVLVPNAYTRENMKKDHWGALDRTLMGVHFYYSALSERRLWFEGPHYIMDTSRARLRAHLASTFFYGGRPLPHGIVTTGPCYALVDRHVADGAAVQHRGHRRVFANERIEIYRIPQFEGVHMARDAD